MSEHYHVDNFRTHIRVKENAPQVLHQELTKAGYLSQKTLEKESLLPFFPKSSNPIERPQHPRKIIIGVCGGVSDGYQPAEGNAKITRQILETLLDFELPVFVLTKSTLVLRDLDLLKEIHERTFANVMFTITMFDEEKKKVIEPNSPPTWERFDTLKEIRKAGLYGGVMATPIIPTIGDNLENMQNLAKAAKKANAEFIQFGGLTLKPGRQKDFFFDVLRKHFPQETKLLRKFYSNENRYGQPDFRLLPVNSMLRGYSINKKIGIRDIAIRHKLPQEYPTNHPILQILLEIIFRKRFMLGEHWDTTMVYQHFAELLEKGVGDLKEHREKRTLTKELGISQNMVKLVEEVLDRGSSQVLDEVLQQLDLRSESL
jgi:DNA repair photolyase